MSGGHQLGIRLPLGAFAVALLGGLLWMDASRGSHLGLGLLMMLGIPAALAEFYGLAQAAGHRPLRDLGVLLGVVLTGLTVWGLRTEGLLLLPLLAFFGIMARAPQTRRIEDLAITLMGLLYLWLPLSYAMRLRTGFTGSGGLAGHAALLFALASGKGSDIGAYFVGVSVGGRRLAPILSPGKTWAGMAGALLGGAGAGWGVARLWPVLPVSPEAACVLGGLLGVSGQCADLWESLLKRQAGMKDSGRLLPAFGGVLDLLDSLVLVPPLAYYGLLALKGWRP